MHYILSEILYNLVSRNITYMNEYTSDNKPNFYDIKTKGTKLLLLGWPFVSDSSNYTSFEVLPWTDDA